MSQRPPSIEGIMERLSWICARRDCSVKVRPNAYYGSNKWFVFLSCVVVSSVRGGGLRSFHKDGATPEEAIQNTWQSILALTSDPDYALMRFNCRPNVSIPGEEPQVWVRWNGDLSNWEDVSVPRLQPEQLRTYKDQFLIDGQFADR